MFYLICSSAHAPVSDRAVAYASEQPDNVDINEIVLHPTAPEF